MSFHLDFRRYYANWEPLFPVDPSFISSFGSSLRVAQRIFRDEGRVLGFYRGLTPNIVGNSISWAFYFVAYGEIKDGIHSLYHESRPLSSRDYLLASAAAGLVTAACTNPIWVIKTRMLSTASKYPGAYTSMFDGAKQIASREGFGGFYRGLAPSLLGVSHGALQFMAYERLKIHQAETKGVALSDLGAPDFLALSSLSKVFAGTVTYPYQVVRSRLQTYEADSRYQTTRGAIQQVWFHEGLGGFYKGLGPNLLRVLPSTWVTFLVYEKVRASFV